MAGLLDENTLLAAGGGAFCTWKDDVTVTVTFGDGAYPGLHISMLTCVGATAVRAYETAEISPNTYTDVRV